MNNQEKHCLGPDPELHFYTWSHIRHYMYDSHQNYYYAADAARNIDSRTKSYHAANKEFPGDDDEAEQMLST